MPASRISCDIFIRILQDQHTSTMSSQQIGRASSRHVGSLVKKNNQALLSISIDSLKRYQEMVIAWI